MIPPIIQQADREILTSNACSSEKPAASRKTTEYPRIALPHNICAAQTTQFCQREDLSENISRQWMWSTHNFSSSQVGALETFPEACIYSLSLFQCCRVLDICESRVHLSLLVGCILTKTHQTLSRQVDLTTSNRIPWRLGSNVSSNQEGNWPDPLQSKWESPSQVTVEARDGPNNARGEKDASAPAHTNIRSNVWPEYDWNHLGCIYC